MIEIKNAVIKSARINDGDRAKEALSKLENEGGK